MYMDEERGMLARTELEGLTGRSPKPWETDKRYLEKVLRPAATAVAGSVVKSKTSR